MPHCCTSRARRELLDTTAYVGFTLGRFTLTQASTTSGATITWSFDANVDQQGTAPP